MTLDPDRSPPARRSSRSRTAPAEAAFLPLIPTIRDDLEPLRGGGRSVLRRVDLRRARHVRPGRPARRPLRRALAPARERAARAGGARAHGARRRGCRRCWSRGSSTASPSRSSGRSLPASLPRGSRVRGGSGSVVAASGIGWLVGPVALRRPGAGLRLAAPARGHRRRHPPAAIPFVRSLDARAPRPAGASPGDDRAAPRSRRAAWAVVLSGLLGVVTGAIGVLVPTVLSDNGVPASGIGIAIAVSVGVWALAAACSGRIGRGRDRRAPRRRSSPRRSRRAGWCRS